eukprot:COSAG02_NODE_6257_length_3698_cov_1.391220_3_plen_70_part_00
MFSFESHKIVFVVALLLATPVLVWNRGCKNAERCWIDFGKSASMTLIYGAKSEWETLSELMMYGQCCSR